MGLPKKKPRDLKSGFTRFEQQAVSLWKPLVGGDAKHHTEPAKVLHGRGEMLLGKVCNVFI